MKRVPWRVFAVLLLLPACCASSGCTYLMWTKHGLWPPARNEYEQIEAVAIGDNDDLFIRLQRAHSGTETWRIVVRRPESATGKWTLSDPISVDDGQFPQQSRRTVACISRSESVSRKLSAPPGDDWLLVGLSPYYETLDHLTLYPNLELVDPRWPDNWAQVDLAYPQLAWLTGNILLHILLTPPAIAFDAAFWPFEVAFALLVAIGRGGC
ncbi:MAG: hypothetical protein K8T20_18105 [Planctomycetes bacterium]|nr:hypothetical protein [Planctomycetota bacterium]